MKFICRVCKEETFADTFEDIYNSDKMCKSCIYSTLESEEPIFVPIPIPKKIDKKYQAEPHKKMGRKKALEFYTKKIADFFGVVKKEKQQVQHKPEPKPIKAQKYTREDELHFDKTEDYFAYHEAKKILRKLKNESVLQSA